jgi:hypothetical protein
MRNAFHYACAAGRMFAARWWMIAAAILVFQPATHAQTQTAANLAAPDAMGFREEPSPKRILEVVPNFQASNQGGATWHPLTVKEKFVIATQNSFDVSAHLGNALQAGIQQAANGEPNYGKSWGAYGLRFAASEGDQITGSYLTYALLPVVFHEDPRYFRRGQGRAISRVVYAISRTAITKADDGRTEFNKSQAFGQLISCGISTAYYPAQDRTAGGVALNWAISMGYKERLQFAERILSGSHEIASSSQASVNASPRHSSRNATKNC